MKWVSMADLLTLFLCPQLVSDFEHEMGQWLSWSLCFHVFRQRVILSMKWVSMADLDTFSLCPQAVNDFKHEMGVNG